MTMNNSKGTTIILDNNSATNSTPIRSKASKATKASLRFRFYTAIDIQLLRLAIQYNPWMNGPKAWNQISDELKQKEPLISARAARERCNALMAAFKQQDLVSMNKSGTEEMFDERAILIAEILSLKEGQEQVDQIITIVGPNDEEEILHCVTLSSGPSTDVSNSSNSCSLSPIPVKIRKLEKQVADNAREVSKNSLQCTVDGRTTMYAPKKKKDDILIMKVDAEVKLKFQEFDLKKKIEEEKIKLKEKAAEEEINLNIMKAQAEIKMQQKQLDLEEKRLQLEEKRLQLEEKKLTNDNTVHQQMIEQQKIFLELLRAKK